MNTKSAPTILPGTRDFLPNEVIRRNRYMGIIKGIFEQFGYLPIETPILSPAETILGKYGDEGDNLTYVFYDSDKRKIALPYDLTVPFARYVATNYKKLTMPFKRYQIQKVWRAEKPHNGCLKEFYQCDIDIIGSKSLICEAEIVRIIVEVFKRLAFENFIIKINSRRLLSNILMSNGIPKENLNLAIQVIDKMNKIEKDLVTKNLKDLGIKKVNELFSLLKMEETNSLTLKKLKAFDIIEFEKFLSILKNLSVSERFIQIDPLLARGLLYYTGLIFEVVLKEDYFDTLCAGGRYDNLCSYFCDEDFSGAGASFGFERIMMLLNKIEGINDIPTISKVLVTIFNEKSIESALTIYNLLINEAIATEIYFEPDKLSLQIKYAIKKKIPFVVTCSKEEEEQGLVSIKRTENGKQKTIPLVQLVSYIKGYYEAK